MFMRKIPKKTEFPHCHAKKKHKKNRSHICSCEKKKTGFSRCSTSVPFVVWLDRSGSGGGVFNVYYGGDEELLRLGQLKLDLGSSALAPGRPRPIDDGLLIREIKPLANGPTFFRLVNYSVFLPRFCGS